jgi:alcohol dehydrogenase
MRAVCVTRERCLAIRDIAAPPPPALGEVQVRIRTVALNHIDVWSWRGMAFARRKLPLVAGAEAAGDISAIGEGVGGLEPGQKVAIYGALTCGCCAACLDGRDNLCEATDNIYGFHIDGFLRELINIPARLAIPAPAGLGMDAIACVPITFGTPEHMLFTNARLAPGETVLVHAGGSGVGSVAIQLAKAAGARVITTVGSDEKAEKALALGADEVINYRRERFEAKVRKLTDRNGVDVVFEHVGAETWPGSLLSLKRGGRLVTCGSTTGIAAQTNLFLIFQQQLKILGSFGCAIRDMTSAMGKLAAGQARPVIDSVIGIEGVEAALKRLEDRNVFGKILVRL